MRLTGPTITALRTSLDISVTDFAKLVGVHPSTLYRWEGQDVCKADPLQIALLTVLQEQVQTQDKLWRARLREIVQIQGLLPGLHFLLDTSKYRSKQ